jgi:hypothetical protein
MIGGGVSGFGIFGKLKLAMSLDVVAKCAAITISGVNENRSGASQRFGRVSFKTRSTG